MVVLPAPFGPMSALICPSCTAEAHVFQGLQASEPLRHLVDAQQRHGDP